jgi:spore coat protein CotH
MRIGKGYGRILKTFFVGCLVAGLICPAVMGLTGCGKGPAVWQDASTDLGEMTELGEGEATSDAETGVADLRETTPICSIPGGIYTKPQAVSMTCSDDYTIHYTTDGSIPTAASTAYRKAVAVLEDKTTSVCLRAACFDDTGRRVGDVVTHTYVRKEPDALYTVSITVEKQDLDYLTDNYPHSYERPAHVEVIEPTGDCIISQDVGLRLFGGSSRSLAQKSFKIIARKDGYFGEGVAYNGSGSFKCALFPDRLVKSGENAGQVLDRYDSFILRNGGNDSLLHRSVDPDQATLLRDGLANGFAYDVAPHVDASLSQFAEVYVNGEYYGLLDMRENLNENYVKRVYGVTDEDVVVIKSELDTHRVCDEHEGGEACRYCDVWFYYETDESEAAQAQLQAWLTLCQQAIAAIGADDAVYASMYQQIADKVDLDSFMEYMALNMYVCNTDWPHNNVKLWRYTGERQEGIAITDGKWRFMTRDMDMAFARYRSPDVTSELDNRAHVDTFYRVLGLYLDGYHEYYSYEGEERLYPDSLYLQGLLAFCLRNGEFRAAFEDYCRMLANDASEACLKEWYDKGYTAIEDDIAAHIKRWLWRDSSPRTWRDACAGIKTFIQDRGDHFTFCLERMLSMYA